MREGHRRSKGERGENDFGVCSALVEAVE